MAAWSAEPFGNDDANDWAFTLKEADDLTVAQWAFDQLGQDVQEDFVSPDAVSDAIAAAATVALTLGAGESVTGKVPSDVREFVKRNNPEPSAQLVASAVEALDLAEKNTDALEPETDDEDDDAAGTAEDRAQWNAKLREFLTSKQA